MKKIIIVGIIFIFFILRLYKIDSLPGEWYGDISNVHEYEMQIQKGEWPFYFFQSPGPLYHYLIAPFVFIYKNNGYETYKISSIIVSLIGLISTYFFVKEISTKKIALITVLTMSLSLWYLIWSRLGNSQIVIPALVSLMSLFIARYIKKKKFNDLLLAVVSASLGWYTYPQTFILPVLFILFIIAYLIFKKEILSRFYSIGLTVVILALCAIPFVNIVRQDKGNFGPQGYVGGKILPIRSMPLHDLLAKIATNYTKVLLMLHVKGDEVFRSNVSNHPQIDLVSGIIFFAGFLYFLKKKRRIWLFYILWMLFLLPIPSISPALPEGEIPNSARTIAVIPMVFLLVGSGLIWFYVNLRKIIKRQYIVASVISLIFGFIVYLNMKLYFVDYSQGLPDNNLAPGRIIAKYVDKFPANVAVYFASCCWGGWGEPEPKGVAYVLRQKREIINFNKLIENCNEIEAQNAVVVISPSGDDQSAYFMKCGKDSRLEAIKTSQGDTVAKMVIINQ